MSKVELNGIATLPNEEEAAKIRRGKPFRKNGKVIDPGAVDRSVVALQAPKGLRRSVGEMFEAALVRRIKLYKCDALDALHDLACMPISDNSAQNHIKYLAACRLAGNTEGPQAESGLEETLRKLNDRYRVEAPRIKSVRERVTTFEMPEAIDAIATD